MHIGDGCEKNISEARIWSRIVRSKTYLGVSWLSDELHHDHHNVQPHGV